jgi:hypothetical protein
MIFSIILVPEFVTVAKLSTVSFPMIASNQDRRRFLRYSLAAAASPLWLPWAEAAGLAEARTVRVRGRVRAGHRGLPGVAISDGVSVSVTDRDGHFELAAAPDAFIRCSIPGDHEIATSPAGTARLYQPVAASSDKSDKDVSMLFELQPRRDSAEQHQFLVLADPQTQTRAETGYFNDETVPDVQALLKSRAGVPTFGVGCGDMMWDDLSLYPEYERGVTAMGVPFFQVIGNHDLDLLARSDEGSCRTFLDRFGPTYYSFNVGAIHYVVLDDVMWHGTGYIGYIDERQLKWLEADLSQVERGRTVVVFTHIPLLCTQHRRLKQSTPSVSQVVTNRLAIYRLLEGYKAHVMTGHTHENEHVFEQGVHEHIHGAVCGAWWTGPVCFDGTPKGYGVYDVRGEELRWHYKSTGQPSTHQMRIYAPGSDPRQPGVLIANVWNWDPKWQVVWYEDGEQRPPLEQYTAQDPMSVGLYGGPSLPAARQWIEPMTTAHLFRCTPASTAREVRIEATDPFGTRYSETWRPSTA